MSIQRQNIKSVHCTSLTFYIFLAISAKRWHSAHYMVIKMKIKRTPNSTLGQLWVTLPSLRERELIKLVKLRKVVVEL